MVSDERRCLRRYSNHGFDLSHPAESTREHLSSSMHIKRPCLDSKRDLTILCDVDDFDTGKFLRSTFAYVDENSSVWFGQSEETRQRLSVESVNQSLELVPDFKIYPPVSPRITTLLPEAISSEVYIKRPKLLHLDEEDDGKVLPRMLLDEVEIYELLKQHPHPNIARYVGCSVKRNYITGIVLEKYPSTLENLPAVTTGDFDFDACIQGIRSGLEHLHSLGFAHNDINPRNIALDAAKRPVILDFGSCRRFGEQLLSAGTPGWVEDITTSERRHDEAAIIKIHDWLKRDPIQTPTEARE